MQPGDFVLLTQMTNLGRSSVAHCHGATLNKGPDAVSKDAEDGHEIMMTDEDIQSRP